MSGLNAVIITVQWREHWLSASVVNHTIVTDQPGLDLPRRMMVSAESFPDRSRSMSCKFCKDGSLPTRLSVNVDLWTTADNEPRTQHVPVNKI